MDKFLKCSKHSRQQATYFVLGNDIIIFSFQKMKVVFNIIFNIIVLKQKVQLVLSLILAYAVLFSKGLCFPLLSLTVNGLNSFTDLTLVFQYFLTDLWIFALDLELEFEGYISEISYHNYSLVYVLLIRLLIDLQLVLF